MYKLANVLCSSAESPEVNFKSIFLLAYELFLLASFSKYSIYFKEDASNLDRSSKFRRAVARYSLTKVRYKIHGGTSIARETKKNGKERKRDRDKKMLEKLNNNFKRFYFFYLYGHILFIFCSNI